MVRDTLTGLTWLHARMEEMELESLEEVARLCGMNRGTLYRYFTFETRPSVDVLPKLCTGLGVSPHEVLRALAVQIPRSSALK